MIAWLTFVLEGKSEGFVCGREIQSIWERMIALQAFVKQMNYLLEAQVRNKRNGLFP
jgi:hypothetical protein